MISRIAIHQHNFYYGEKGHILNTQSIGILAFMFIVALFYVEYNSWLYLPNLVLILCINCFKWKLLQILVKLDELVQAFIYLEASMYYSHYPKYMAGEIIFHLVHTYFMGVVWILDGWWNHFPYNTVTATWPCLGRVRAMSGPCRGRVKAVSGPCRGRVGADGLQIIFKFITWKRIWIKSSLGITWMVNSFSIYYIPISWTADYLQIHYLKNNLDQE